MKIAMIILAILITGQVFIFISQKNLDNKLVKLERERQGLILQRRWLLRDINDLQITVQKAIDRGGRR